jgi:hypothetical protein
MSVCRAAPNSTSVILPTRRFAKVVQESVAAAPFSAAAEDPASLLDTHPALLACEPAAADFWTVSNAAAEQAQAYAAAQPQQQRGKRLRPYNERLHAEAVAVSGLLGGDRLVWPKRPRLQSRAVMQLQAGVAAAEAQRQPKVEEMPAKGTEGGAQMLDGSMFPLLLLRPGCLLVAFAVLLMVLLCLPLCLPPSAFPL